MVQAIKMMVQTTANITVRVMQSTEILSESVLAFPVVLYKLKLK